MADDPKTPVAEIIAVGSELLLGDRIDTNSGEIQMLLLGAGVRTRRVTVIGDAAAEIAACLREAAGRADAVIVTGGLGPTADDVTREAAAAAAGVGIEEDEEALRDIQAYFDRIRRPMKAGNRRQSLFPGGAEVIANSCGTAPGFSLHIGRCVVFCIPGVPVEMRAMMAESVLPSLQREFPGVPVPARHKVHLIGVPESSANDRILGLMTGSDPQVGMTAHDMVITISITSWAPGGREKVAAAARTVHAEFGSRIFAEGDGVSLPAAVIRLLDERSITLATAESCTGGLVGYLLTSAPGSSAVYREGAVTYTGAAKTRALGVPAELIAARGEVSAEVARAMAEGAAARAGCRAGLGVTGIAGPGGGTPEKPVGLVHIAACLDGETAARELRFAGDRDTVRKRSAMAALDLLRRLVLGEH